MVGSVADAGPHGKPARGDTRRLRRGGRAQKISHAEFAEGAEFWTRRERRERRGYGAVASVGCPWVIRAIRVRPSHPRRALRLRDSVAPCEIAGARYEAGAEEEKPRVPPEHRRQHVCFAGGWIMGGEGRKKRIAYIFPGPVQRFPRRRNGCLCVAPRLCVSQRAPQGAGRTGRPRQAHGGSGAAGVHRRYLTRNARSTQSFRCSYGAAEISRGEAEARRE